MGTVHKQQSTTVAEGKVIKTDPASGATVRSKSSVDIYVSSGNENIIKMKDFVGEKIDDAMATLLKDYGIDESQVIQTSVPSDSYAAGTIIKQTPKKGSSFDVTSGDKIINPIPEHGASTRIRSIIISLSEESFNSEFEKSVLHINA